MTTVIICGGRDFSDRPRFIAAMDELDIGKPDLVIAFPGGRGTADMIERARRAGVPVIEPLASIPRDHLTQRPCELDLGDEMFEERHAVPPRLRSIYPEGDE